MREFVLNDASLRADHVNVACSWLVEIARGMGSLVDAKLVGPSLRSRQSIHEIECAPGTSLFDAYRGMIRTNRHTEALFLMQLDNLAPVQSGLDEFLKDRFLRCEAIGCDDLPLPPELGEPLVLCAISGSIAVSFPTASIWDRDELEVAFKELLDNDSIVNVMETVNAVARSSHAKTVATRLMDIERAQISTYAEMWDARNRVFPNLTFGPEVHGQLRDLNAGWLTTLKEKLAKLDNDARNWKSQGGRMPRWSTKVTDESDRVKNSDRLSSFRMFKSVSGQKRCFYWHARFGSSQRIHLRFDPDGYRIEIGYIGNHLPLYGD